MPIHPFVFFQAFLRRIQPPPALRPAVHPDCFYQYFYDRGISDAMIAESGAFPLTLIPSAEECEQFKRYLKRPRLDKKSGAPADILSGIVFPFFIDAVDYGDYGEARVFQWSARALDFWQKDGGNIPKTMSPRSNAVKATSHLYILPSEAEKLKSSNVEIAVIEGIAKTLKLIQDMRSAGISNVAVIGIQGVERLLSAPEAHQLNWRSRGVYLFFDADAQRKTGVAQAELKAAAFAASKGAKFCKSAIWKEDRGNGYDDHSVFAEKKGFAPSANLPNLIKKARDTFEKHAPAEDKIGVPVDVMCRAVAKVPGLMKHQRTVILNKIGKLYRPMGLKTKDVTDIYSAQHKDIEAKQQARKLEENGELLRSMFDVPYVPDMPENFFIRQGLLYCGEQPLCRVFVIKKYISTDDQDKQDYYLLSFRGKDILIPSDIFANSRKIAEIFNRNREILHDAAARDVQKFIAQYWIRNRNKPIPVVPMFENTGWDHGGTFRIPTRDGESEYTAAIKQAFVCNGDPDAQRAFVRRIMSTQTAAIGFMLAFATPLIGLFNLKPMVVMIYGNPGDGKSTMAFAALSLYGLWEKLYQSMNATKVGKEVSCAMSKDLPVCFDEMNTAGNGDGKVLAQQLVETIYGFYSGKGRTRSTVNITLAKQNEYQGLLMLTSEKSLSSIFSVMSNMNLGGAYRRTLEIPVLDQHTLWKYTDASGAEVDGATFFKDIYDNINAHYGYVGASWIDYISDPDVQRTVKEAYHHELAELGKQGIELKGTDHLIALVKALYPFVEEFLELDTGTIQARCKDYVQQIIEQQQRQIDFQVRNGAEKFVESLNSFLAAHSTCFDGLCPENYVMQNIYGKVLDSKPADDGSRKRHVFLRPQGLRDLCNAYGFDRNGLLVQLKQSGIFTPWTRTVTDDNGKRQTIETDYKSMKIRGSGGDAYRFVIDAPAEYDNGDLVDGWEPPTASRKGEKEEEAL